jgi:hypothetical protein
MATRIKLRRDTNANWTTNNPILSEAEIGIVTDAASSSVKLKIGDGLTRWNSLSYFAPTPAATAWGSITGTLSSQTDLQSALDAKQNTLGYTAANDAQVVHLSGDESISGVKTFTSTPVFPNDSIAYSKIQNVSATNRILGRISVSAGDIEELTGTNVKAILGLATTTTDNAVVRHDGTGGNTQTSGVIIDDSNNISGLGTVACGAITSGSDTDLTTVLGRVKLGSPTTDIAYFAHFDKLDATNFALSQNSSGATILNAQTSVNIAFQAGTIINVGNSGVTVTDGKNFIFSSTTGTKFGTATTQKLALWNATPIVQPSSTGESTGFTAGAGSAVDHLATFTGNVGTKAYTINDIVKHLKNIGALAAS